MASVVGVQVPRWASHEGRGSHPCSAPSSRGRTGADPPGHRPLNGQKQRQAVAPKGARISAIPPKGARISAIPPIGARDGAINTGLRRFRWHRTLRLTAQQRPPASQTPAAEASASPAPPPPEAFTLAAKPSARAGYLASPAASDPWPPLPACRHSADSTVGRWRHRQEPSGGGHGGAARQMIW